MCDPGSTSQGLLPSASASASWMRALQRTANVADEPLVLLADLIDAHAATQADAPALISENVSLTYGQLSWRMNQYARWALDHDLEPGDTVCLLLENCPDYLAIWLGLSRVGIVTALINTQIAGASLAHCMTIATPKAVIVGDAWIDTYRAAMLAGQGLDPWTFGGGDETRRLDHLIVRYDGVGLSGRERAAVTLNDHALLIYTSGTTGLPKAAKVSHFRVRMWSQWFAGLMDACPDDRLYNCMPMYHSVGGVVATGAMLAGGGSVVIRERFSASRFWQDIVATECTIFQYIGELCRYLVNQPEQPLETKHRLRICCGNGLRADVWENFKSRFNIPRVLEFYASTEGSFSLFNVEGEPGAIGKVPGFLAHRSPVAIVRFDTESEVPLRNGEGFCIRCEVNEAGEAIGRVVTRDAGLSTRFEGYTNSADTEKKVLRDVFAKGDAWFRTGDLMRKDARGFYYFVDRIGDTFRWKGENVATSEVEAALCQCPNVLEANVYGVRIPGADGRAGMAALVVDPAFDLAALHAVLATVLPPFARPLFLRLRTSLEITGTFKQKKQDLVREGYDLKLVSDPLFVDHPPQAGYVELTTTLHAAIAAGLTRL